MYRRLKYLREERKEMQKDIAKLVGISKSQFSLYENENVTIPIKYLIILSNYFDVSLDYIFEFTDIKNYKNVNKEIDSKKAGILLKSLRKENNLTQIKLSEFLNTSFSNISSYERGINLLATNYLYAICKKYNISADYLLGRIDSPKYLK